MTGCVTRHTHHRVVNFMEAVGENEDEVGAALLPAPPATFSDPPPAPPRCSVSTSPGNQVPSKGFVVGQQLLRVHAPPSGHHAGLRELESSVSSKVVDVAVVIVIVVVVDDVFLSSLNRN